jgi:hypothetical protein
MAEWTTDGLGTARVLLPVCQAQQQYRQQYQYQYQYQQQYQAQQQYRQGHQQQAAPGAA